MTYALKTSRQETEEVKRMTFGPVVAVIAATDAAFVFGLVAMLSWEESVVAILVAIALAGGSAFTVRELRRLEKESGR
ncbi:MAG TPA: hypothetical protein VG096_26310 [Bryobacteraceae bacterium]|jgi:hypothetical protein|nr:hypothetical protein [Bryobacteraceae bacterium]